MQPQNPNKPNPLIGAIMGIAAVIIVLKTGETLMDIGEVSQAQYKTLEKDLLGAKDCPAAKKILREYLSDSKITPLEMTRIHHARASCKPQKTNTDGPENSKGNAILRLKKLSEG